MQQMTSREIALRENIATLPTSLTAFIIFMHCTKSGLYFLTTKYKANFIATDMENTYRNAFFKFGEEFCWRW